MYIYIYMYEHISIISYLLYSTIQFNSTTQLKSAIQFNSTIPQALRAAGASAPRNELNRRIEFNRRIKRRIVELYR